MSRRVFLKSTAAAGAGLTLAIHFGDALAQASGPGRTVGSAAAGSFEPNAFLRIGKDNTVTVVVKHLEMGQGVYTGLPTLVAEELDAAWSQVRVEGAPADASRYNNLLWGPAQGTGGSTAIANSFEQYRQAGAAARAMLVAAAAEQWKVPADSVKVSAGVVSHASGRKATFGELADAAGRQPVPSAVKLKDAKDFVYIGKHVPRTDSKAKSNGTARFTQDVKLPDMLTAVVAHAPRFGQKVNKVDSSAVTGIPGVRYVVEIPNGRGGDRDDVLGGEEGPRRAQGRVGRRDRLQGLVGRHDGRVPAARGARRPSRRATTATRSRHWTAARRSSRPCTSFRTSRTRRWSR